MFKKIRTDKVYSKDSNYTTQYDINNEFVKRLSKLENRLENLLNYLNLEVKKEVVNGFFEDSIIENIGKKTKPKKK